jgi:hypothetical protein
MRFYQSMPGDQHSEHPREELDVGDAFVPQASLRQPTFSLFNGPADDNSKDTDMRVSTPPRTLTQSAETNVKNVEPTRPTATPGQTHREDLERLSEFYNTKGRLLIQKASEAFRMECAAKEKIRKLRAGEGVHLDAEDLRVLHEVLR